MLNPFYYSVPANKTHLTTNGLLGFCSNPTASIREETEDDFREENEDTTELSQQQQKQQSQKSTSVGKVMHSLH